MGRPNNTKNLLKIMNPYDISALVVDDDCAALETIQKMLAFIGLDNIDSCNASDCFDKYFKPGKYNLVIIDYFLDVGLKGTDIIKRIRKIDDEVIVMLITGYPSEVIYQGILEYGIDDFLTKPVLIDTLAYRILLNLSRVRRMKELDLSICNKYDVRIRELREQANEIGIKMARILMGEETQNHVGETEPRQGRAKIPG